MRLKVFGSRGENEPRPGRWVQTMGHVIRAFVLNIGSRLPRMVALLYVPFAALSCVKWLLYFRDLGGCVYLPGLCRHSQKGKYRFPCLWVQEIGAKGRQELGDESSVLVWSEKLEY